MRKFFDKYKLKQSKIKPSQFTYVFILYWHRNYRYKEYILKLKKTFH